MAKSHVGHDAVVGAGCELATGCIIGGYAEIGDAAKIGLNAVVLPYRKVGEGATVGAGSVVTKDVPAGETWCGNPARPVERNPVPYTERERECVS
jgi:acetyltransferase-like isoleucine patch superfamily enzyme